MLLPGTASAAQVTIEPGDVRFEQWSVSGTDSWATGNLGDGYVEGQVVPFRVTVTGAGNSDPGDVFKFSICRAYEDSGQNGYLFLDDYDTSVSPNLEGAVEGNTISSVTGAGKGATVTILSVADDTTPATGDCSPGERETEVELTISGLNGSDEAYVLWGGHLASPFDAGVTTGASAYNGATLRMTFFPSKTLVAKVDPAPAGTLTVTKNVVNDNGGTLTASNFPLFVNGNPVTTGVATTLPAGPYTVSETQQAGYERLSFGGACAPDGTVTLGDDQNLTCTITNGDVAPRLTVIKHVVNDHGGSLAAGAFTMNVTGTDVSDASFPGDEAGTTVTLDAGDYSVSETGPAGYAGSLDNGCAGTIALGESKTCLITNDDQAASLTVIKNVVNDHGGTLHAAAFTMNVTGTRVSDASFPGSAGTTVILDAGAYSVTEDVVAGYTPSYSADCTGTIAVGQSRTCTVTNDDVAPTLTVVKTVVNDDEGTLDADDFTMNVAGLNVSDGSFPGDEAGTTVTLDAGSYAVTEDAVAGYAGSFSSGCAGTIGVGQTRTCTVTNNDIPVVVVPPVEPAAGHIVVRKVTLPTASTQAFPFTADFDADGFSLAGGGSIDSGELRPDTYSVAEAATTGWNLTSAICDDGSNPASIALGAGETVTCTFTNTQIPVTVPTETEGVTQTQGSPNVPVETATVTAVPPADVPKATAPVTIPQTSPTAAEELPRTGAAGLREETLLGLLLMLAGLLAKGAGRRTRPSDV